MLVSIPEFTALILLFSKWRPSAILDFKTFAIFIKIQIIAYFYVHTQNLAKIAWSEAEL